MAGLSEWLDIMLGEIARKQDESARAAVEQALRSSDTDATFAARSAVSPVPPRNPA